MTHLTLYDLFDSFAPLLIAILLAGRVSLKMLPEKDAGHFLTR